MAEPNTLTITDVRPWGGPVSTIRIDDGRISALDPAPAPPDRATAGRTVDGSGRIAIPAFSDVHVHLDSTRLGLPFRPHSTPAPGLWSQVMNDRDNWRQAEAPVADRAAVTLALGIARGATRVRGPTPRSTPTAGWSDSKASPQPESSTATGPTSRSWPSPRPVC